MQGNAAMKRGTAESYTVFVRDWWRAPDAGESRSYAPEGVPKVPYPGAPRRTIATGCTLAEAREICEEYARTHEPGWQSRKAEFERE